MEAHIAHLDKLMLELSEKTGYPLDTQGLKEMSEAIKLKEKYLYEYIYRKKEKARAEGALHISAQPSKLDTMTKFLGYKNYQAFVTRQNNPIDPVLQSLAGNYYLYVRRNDDKGFIFRSPVRIQEVNGKMMLALTGPMRTYSGSLRLNNGCLFILMEEPGGKQFHHVYKIGTRHQPTILQGIFSGVSTSFDPIGGRSVLVRVSDDQELSTKEATVNEYRTSTVFAEKNVAAFLADFSTNNLRINTITTFGPDDLGS